MSALEVTIDTGQRAARRIPTVAIVGPGLVGATTAYALMMSGVAAEIILIGRDRNRAEAQVKDLRDATLYSRPTRVVTGELGDCGNADVIIVAVGSPQHQNMNSRFDELKSSAVMVKEVMTQLARLSPTGVLVIASNPVDVMTYAAWKWSGLPKGRVIGSGTILDSSRFRRRLGERYGIASENVHAYVVGEHGDSQVALLSSARVGGTLLQGLRPEPDALYDTDTLRQIADSARRGGQDIVRTKGGTNYGISSALTRIAAAVLRDEHAVLTVSTVVPDSMRLGDVSLSVPAVIGQAGVRHILPLQLNDEETLALQRSADIVKRHIATLDLPV